MNRKERISKRLSNLGMAWAIQSSKFVCVNHNCCPFGSKPAYHIHPDASYPHESNIVRRSSLDEVEEWLDEVEARLIADAACRAVMEAMRSAADEFYVSERMR